MDKTTKWILELTDRVTGPLQRVAKQAGAAYANADRLADRLNVLETRSSKLSGSLRNIGIAGAAFGVLSFGAMKYDQDMAKVNATAQLSQEKLAGLKKELIEIGSESGGNFRRMPDAFEKILSLTNDTTLSLEILRASTKGAKAGFADIDTVAGAVANTVALVGKQNTNAMEVLDTFQAAKNLGGGEFEDFAAYMPQMIAAGKTMGVGFKDVAGVFSFMTSKGNDAASSAMLIQNAFSGLTKGPVMKGLQEKGLDIFNVDGTVKNIGEIMTVLGKRLDTMTDQQRAQFFVDVGLNDIQARQAINILTSDTGKLNSILQGTSSATGALDQALRDTENPMTKMSDMMDKLMASLLPLIDTFTPFITALIGAATVFFGWISDITEAFPVFSKLSAIFMGAAFLLGSLGIAFAFVITKVQIYRTQLALAALQQNSLTGAIARTVIGLAVQTASLFRNIGAFIISGTVAIATFIAGLTGATAAQWLLNIAMNANPLGLIVLGVAAVIGALTLLYTYWDQIVAVMVKVGKFFLKWNPFTWVFSLIYELFPQVREWVDNIFDSIMQYIEKVWGFIKGIVEKVKGWFGGTVDVDVKTPDPDIPDPKQNGQIPGMGDFELPDLSGANGTNTGKGTPTAEGTGSGGKIITMNLDISNAFNVAPGTNIEDIADQLTARLVKQLRDGLIAAT